MSEEKRLTDKEADAKIDEHLANAYEAIREAEALANEYGLEFSFDVSYGMGGTYYSPKQVQEDSWLQDNYYLDPNEGGWVASSQTC